MKSIQPTSLYIHIPFCKQKCFYCSFAVSIGQEKRRDVYLDCLEKEAQSYQGTKLDTVYIGGGTPTFLELKQLERLFNIIQNVFVVNQLAEFTIEANPEDVTIQKMTLLKDLGINRISLGVQSLNNKYLTYSGRNHDQSTVFKAVEVIKRVGFDNVNLDLMFSFPQQTIDELRSDLEQMTQLKSDHLSLYSLTIEKDSRFFTKNIQLPNDEKQAEQYLLVIEHLEKNGFKQYEVSNFAKEGKESKHNLHYWQGGRYVGLGVGAHSYLGARRFWNIAKLTEYINKINEDESVIEGSEDLSPQTQFMERLLFGLRTNSGVNLKEIENDLSISLEETKLKQLQQFVSQDFLKWEGQRLKATTKGLLVLDELSAILI